ncbi:MAG: hypothetical protein ACE5KY_06585 [Candidatus Tectimicrobiota bacterium]
MAHKGKIDLPLTAVLCSHCGGELVLWQPVDHRRIGIRCLKCKCRWNHTRRLASWGRRCPRYVRT